MTSRKAKTRTGYWDVLVAVSDYLEETAKKIIAKHFKRKGKVFRGKIEDVDVYGDFVSVRLSCTGHTVIGYAKRNLIDEFDVDVGLGIAVHRALVRLYKQEKLDRKNEGI